MTFTSFLTTMQSKCPSTPLLIIPTYNEALNTPHLVPEIFKHLPNTHILVVDDNSPDGTADLVRELEQKYPQLHLLVRPGKEGYGRTIIAGYRFALAKGFCVRLTSPSSLSIFLKSPWEEAIVSLRIAYASFR